MIGRIQGTLVSVHPPRLLVDCQGIGYEVDANEHSVPITSNRSKNYPPDPLSGA